MGFLSAAEINHAQRVGAFVPRGPTIPPAVVFSPRPAGYRDGSFAVSVRSVFDTRPPAIAVHNWTPWGWQARAPGATMESF